MLWKGRSSCGKGGDVVGKGEVLLWKGDICCGKDEEKWKIREYFLKREMSTKERSGFKDGSRCCGI